MIPVILLAFACLFFLIDILSRRFWVTPAPGPYYGPWVSIGLLCVAGAMLKIATQALGK